MAAIVQVTTGVPGSGKSYLRGARFVVDEFMLNSSGLLVTNLPLRVGAIADFCALRCSKMGFFRRLGCAFYSKEKVDFVSRVHLLSSGELALLKNGDFSFMDDLELRGAHLLLDEIHELIGASTPPNVVQSWNEFLGTIRHRGCTVEGITQDISNVNDVFLGRCALRIELISVDELRDPYFGIPVSDWLELEAGFTGRYRKFVGYREMIKSGNGRWKTSNTSRVCINPDYFCFYDSFNVDKSPSEIKKSNVSSFPPFPSFPVKNG